ncbi:DNA mismatch repair protein MutS [Faunimonas sp. B44]|uniref:DNA mismatch repair protein MutS n=1 Tax=Faunimonas sp. B44 TaxID=3461493 RepID=UPI004044A0DA
MNERPDPTATEAAGEAAAPARITPMMEQYVEIRAANPDCLLFYRMGDFYELFFDDAVTASRALGITLTKRGKHLGDDIPMCGVPIHAADEYLQKLIALGHRVAVCEQVEDPAEARRRGAKSVVRREVTRLVTPGTLTEDNLLESGRNNYLAALVPVPSSTPDREDHALAWVDISTGEFRIGCAGPGGLAAMLARIEPREVLAPDRLASLAAVEEAGAALTPLSASFFDPATAGERLAAAFGVATMESFGAFTRPELAAGAAVLSYVEKTQIARRPPIEPPRRVGDREALRIDAATRANLELFRTLSGSRAGSLLAAIDRTLTAGGSRLLADRLSNPLCDPAAIDRRLSAVDHLVQDAALRTDLRALLSGAPDMLRALSRLALDRGGPRDLAAIGAGLAAAGEAAARLGGGALPLPDLLGEACRGLRDAPAALATAIAAALEDALPLSKRDGGFVRPGWAAELDEARGLRDESRRVVAALQARYAETTGLRTLRIRHNNVLGYFVEVNASQARALSDCEAIRFVHRQSLASAMRFSTLELGELEQRIASAAERALGLELAVFDDLAASVTAVEAPIRRAAQALAELDVAAGFAELAEAEGYVRPRVDDGLAFAIRGGRHPVVEQVLRRTGETFVGNDCTLGSESGSEGSIWLLTGPNMAGKSTFLRQNALIAILAQTGSFVPAAEARIGVVDQLFSRVGAADDLARGRSTFMVEMVETAAILNQAGERALVILDEIGRGTATYDGLSIAWAAIEHLHETNRCRTLFATHYHELTQLAARLPRLRNATMKVREWKGEVVFLHEIVPGAADRSYGIQVAKLAGLPAPVIARAREVLRGLERNAGRRGPAVVDELPLFAAPPAEPPPPDPALIAIDTLDPDALTPREALERLYDLKRLRRSREE